MAAPTVESVNPLNQATGVVLGTKVVVYFSQRMNTDTLNEGTFVLTGPGQTSVVNPEQLIAKDVAPVTGREYITGSFSFDNSSGKTVMTFDPAVPLQPNQLYSALLLGGDAVLSSDVVLSQDGEALATSYKWSFTTGTLDLAAPPTQAPIPALQQRLDPTTVVVSPRAVVGNDLTQRIELIFPADLDPNSFALTDVLVSVDAMLGDPGVSVPAGTQAQISIEDGNKLVILLTFPPES